MSTLRPTLRNSSKPGLDYSSTYYRVLQATADHRLLIHGKLRDTQGLTCAIGCYFQEADKPINTQAVDEIAAYNDSFPTLTPYQRWRKVRQWLKFKVTQLQKGG